MKKRIRVVLKIGNKFYKFLSILFAGKDGSYFVYNHLKEENSPIAITESIHLLKGSGEFRVDNFKKKISSKGSQIHLSIHPKRLYLKKRSEGGKEEHLMEESEPQSFNKDGFKLHCVFTPAPPLYLPLFNPQSVKKNEEAVIFDWKSRYCPQISIYELNSNFNIGRIVEILPRSINHKLIPADSIHPAIILHLKETDGSPDVWKPNCVIFGKIVHKNPISKAKLQEIIKYNELSFDISSIPNNAIITDYKINNGNPKKPKS